MTQLLIATDEAGYGPKLGPLVITGTAWRLADEQVDQDGWVNRFAALRTPITLDGDRIVVDDSKSVFKPSDGLGMFHAVASAAMHWSGPSHRNLSDWLAWTSPDDSESIRQSRWLNQDQGPPFLDPEQTKPLLQAWCESGVRLSSIRSRIITARAFNSFCSAGHNKADLLSESTLGIVRSLVEQAGSGQADSGQAGIPNDVSVHCDRHGGRRYYGAVLQHAFADWQMQVLSEKQQQSRYRLTRDGQSITIEFTVKGDSFTPVALSSMLAKYTRERLMASFNRYFQQLHRGPCPLKPTAGYPVDADRFLADIESIMTAEQIEATDLIRTR